MYSTIKGVIQSGRYELTDILTKIDTIWLQGGITDEEKTELVSLARENAQPESSYAPLQEQIEKAFAQIAALAERVTALEQGGGEEPEPSDEWPEYIQPTGAHDAYFSGDKVTWNGKHYICIAPSGAACVWNPDAYPAYWQEVSA